MRKKNYRVLRNWMTDNQVYKIGLHAQGESTRNKAIRMLRKRAEGATTTGEEERLLAQARRLGSVGSIIFDKDTKNGESSTIQIFVKNKPRANLIRYERGKVSNWILTIYAEKTNDIIHRFEIDMKTIYEAKALAREFIAKELL